MFRLRGYVKDYEIQESMDKRGTVKKFPVYVGPWFVSVADEEMRQRLKRIYLAMSVLMIALFLGCGMIENAGNRNMINALAYACSCFPVVYNCIGMVAALQLGEKAERKEYDMSVRRMKHSAIGIMVLYPIAVVSEVISLFTAVNKVNILTEILYFMLCGMMVASAWLVQYLSRKYPYRKAEIKQEDK